MTRKLIRKSNIHDVKTMFWLILKANVPEKKHERCMKDIEALLTLLTSDKKMVNPTIR